MPVCQKCGFPIDANGVSFEGRNYHSGCLTEEKRAAAQSLDIKPTMHEGPDCAPDSREINNKSETTWNKLLPLLFSVLILLIMFSHWKGGFLEAALALLFLGIAWESLKGLFRK